MSKPFTHSKPGEKATCPCEKGKPSKSAKAPGNVDSGNGAGDNSRDVEDMDTAEKEKLLKGNTSLVKKFSTSCTLPSLVELAPDDYPKELLSVRLSGHEIKEALLIILLDNVRKQVPVIEPPKWIPADLVSCDGDAVIDR